MSEKEEELNNFLMMTESSDYGAAMEYLERNNWDLSEAVTEYINTHHLRNEVADTSIRDNNQPNYEPEALGSGYSFSSTEQRMPHPFAHHTNFRMDSMDDDNQIDSAQNQPESLMDGSYDQFNNFANNMARSMGSAFQTIPNYFNRNTHNIDQDMEVEEEGPSGRIFLQRFREKNGTGIQLPSFVEGNIDEIYKEAKRLKLPIFFYLHDHKGDSCTIVDQTVISEEIVRELVSKFIWVGINVHTHQGKEVMEEFNIPGAPYMAVMYFDENGVMQNLGSRFGEEINVNALFEMWDTAYDMMSTMFDPMLGVPEFNVADSNLNVVETLIAKAEIEDHLKNRKPTGFVESRRREPEIDPNTGMPVGMTEKQYNDKILKDKQREELEAAMAADRIKLHAAVKQEEETKRKNKEESDMIKLKQEAERMKSFKAQQKKSALPDEPAENDKNATTIQFRLPNSNNIQRRFLKTDKVQLMYDYIQSLGGDNGWDSATGEFGILQNIPKKMFDNYDNTLEEEELYPRAKLYIKENEHA